MICRSWGTPQCSGLTFVRKRIALATPTADTQAAAFKLEARSDMLRYPDNDYGKIVFDPEARGKTDRFVMRLRKPE
jgi:predicted methyltransferase